MAHLEATSQQPPIPPIPTTKAKTRNATLSYNESTKCIGGFALLDRQTVAVFTKLEGKRPSLSPTSLGAESSHSSCTSSHSVSGSAHSDSTFTTSTSSESPALMNVRATDRSSRRSFTSSLSGSPSSSQSGVRLSSISGSKSSSLSGRSALKEDGVRTLGCHRATKAVPVTEKGEISATYRVRESAKQSSLEGSAYNGRHQQLHTNRVKPRYASTTFIKPSHWCRSKSSSRNWRRPISKRKSKSSSPSTSYDKKLSSYSDDTGVQVNAESDTQMPSIHDSSANCDRSRQKSHPQFQVSPPKRVNVHPQVPEAWICNISEHSIANSGVPRTDGKEELRQLAFEPAPTYKKPSTAPPQRVDVFGGTYGDKSLPRRQTPPTPSIKPTQPTRVLARWNLDSSSEYASQGSLATPRSTPTPSNIGFCDPSKCKRSMLEALHPADEKPSAQYVTLAKDLNPSHNLSVPPQTAPSSSVPNSQWPYLTNSKMGHLITASLFPKQGSAEDKAKFRKDLITFLDGAACAAPYWQHKSVFDLSFQLLKVRYIVHSAVCMTRDYIFVEQHLGVFRCRRACVTRSSCASDPTASPSFPVLGLLQPEDENLLRTVAQLRDWEALFLVMDDRTHMTLLVVLDFLCSEIL